MSKTAQIQGPFAANQELITNYPNVNKIGIFSKVNHMININGMPFEIGKTGMLEIEGTDIESLSFQQDEDENTYIDLLEI